MLSWSLLEAMSAGCTIVASDTPPLKEAIIEGKTGRLVHFFDKQALANTVFELLTDKATVRQIEPKCSPIAIENYDLKAFVLPKQLQWVKGIKRRIIMP